jgi:hypothetical protein
MKTLEFKAQGFEQIPDSEFYWGGRAKWAKVEIHNNILDLHMEKPEYRKEVREQMERIFARFYHPRNSWMRICKKTEHCLDLLIALRRKS